MPQLLPEHTTQKIKDGTYFQDAWEWYADRYLSPITHRSILTLAGIVCAITVTICVLNVSSMLPLTITLPLPVSIEDATNNYYSIATIGDKADDPQEAVARFLIDNYVTTRETYISNDAQDEELKQKLRAIKNTSAKNVFIDYRTMLLRTLTNTKRNNSSRKIKIKNIKFLEQDRTSGKALITFTSTWSEGKKETDKNNEWEATLHYRMPDVEILARTPSHIRFFVTYYKLKVLS